MNPIALYDENTSIHDVGNFIMEYQARQNAFTSALVNRIAMVLISSKLWNNPLAKYKRGMFELGETVEEIFVNIAKVHSYDPSEAESTWMKRELPDVRAAFHTMNWQKFYKLTIQRNDLSKAFLSWGGVNELVAYCVDALYTGLAYDEFVTTKYMVDRYMLNGHMYVQDTASVATTAGLESAVKQIRANSRKMTYLKNEYNQANVMNSSDYASQYVWITADLDASMDVDVLAKAFNMERAEFVGHMEVLDTIVPTATETARLAELFANDSTYVPFTDDEKAKLENIVAIVFDKSFFMIFDNLQEMNEVPNGQGLYWQYWLHAWKTFSISPYANAYVLYAGTSGVNAITISPASANVAQGSDAEFTSTVTGTGLFDKAVTYSIKGQTADGEDAELASGTTINALTGRLHVASDETVGVVIVITSTSVSGKTGTATVTVTKG